MAVHGHIVSTGILVERYRSSSKVHGKMSTIVECTESSGGDLNHLPENVYLSCFVVTRGTGDLSLTVL